VAHRAHNTALPWFRQNFIQADPKIPGGFFPAPVTVVQQNDLAQVSERFGIFHPILMAITGGPNIAPTVAWQMSNLYTDTGSSATLGKVIPGSKSLWCWRQLSTITPYAQIAREGAAATDITGGRTFKSFYALHLVDDNTNWPDSDVFYGVILDNGKTAIYTRHITTFAGTTTVLAPEQLIATDDPGGPLLQRVPAIYGGTFPIAKLFAWFSVDLQGNVLIKATLGGTVPPGQAQCLIAAMSGTSNHAMVMRAQSDPTVFSLPTLSHGPQAITGFDITNPEQGPLGRGQGISGSTIGAVINFTGPDKGVYYGQ